MDSKLTKLFVPSTSRKQVQGVSEKTTPLIFNYIFAKLWTTVIEIIQSVCQTDSFLCKKYILYVQKF